MNNKFNIWSFSPLIIILALPLLIYGYKIGTGTKYFFAFLTTIIIPLSLIKAFNIKPFWFVVLSLPILFLAIIFDVQALEYESNINQSTWNTIFDSYTAEVIEFSQDVDLTTKALIFFQIITVIFYLFWTYNKTIIKTSKKMKYVFILILAFFVHDYFHSGATKKAMPIFGLTALKDYYAGKKIEKEYLEVKRNALFNAKRKTEFTKSNKETIVVVVGEATRRDHLEYYGYDRPTTPLMKKENLIVYRDVVSAANQTINSLKRVFTLAEMLDENNYWKQPSFIKAFKEVGFKTFWISTQPIYGKNESEASFIAQETDVFVPHNYENYDLTLLDTYKKILKDTANKKIIFVHILGTHAVYEKRYPDNFNYFAKETSDDNRVNLIRRYDNAVRYNDMFLFELLKELKKEDSENSFIMFSDHGESLYDTPGRNGHGSSEPAQSEVNIPLVLWFSDLFKQNHPTVIKEVSDNVNVPVLSSDFFHAFPGLFGIEFDKLNPKNNFFSKTYIPKTNRKIINGSFELKEYDKLKSTHAEIDY